MREQTVPQTIRPTYRVTLPDQFAWADRELTIPAPHTAAEIATVIHAELTGVGYAGIDVDVEMSTGVVRIAWNGAPLLGVITGPGVGERTPVVEPDPAEVTAIVGTARALLASGWVYDSSCPMSDGVTDRTMYHPTGRHIEAATAGDGTTELTMSGLSLGQVAGAIRGAELTPATPAVPAPKPTVPGPTDWYWRTPAEAAAELYALAAQLDGLDGLPISPIRATVTLQAIREKDTPERRAASVNILADRLGLPAPVTEQVPSGSQHHWASGEVGRMAMSVFTVVATAPAVVEYAREDPEEDNAPLPSGVDGYPVAGRATAAEYVVTFTVNGRDDLAAIRSLTVLAPCSADDIAEAIEAHMRTADAIDYWDDSDTVHVDLAAGVATIATRAGSIIATATITGPGVSR